jgi:ammonia channel protein AmtB
MTRRTDRYRGVTFAVGLWIMSVGWAGAQQGQPPAALPEPTRVETPVEAPSLPPYFTATPESQKPAWPDATGGASGVWATPAGDGKGDIPEQLKSTDLYDRIVHNLYAINYVWVLIAGFLVMFMQAGFMLVEVALCRAKNAAHTAAMNLMIYPLGCLAFWAYGFAIGWGNWWNGPVPPGWYPSLGPGLSVLNHGWGLGAAVDAAGQATGAFTAGIVASLVSMLTLMLKGLKPDPTMCCNGMLAGLVAITAPCAFVNPIGAVIIGAVAGWLVVVSVFFWEKRGIDDPVGAISVHGVNGIWGVLAVGIFATGEYGAGWNGVIRDEFVKLYGLDGVRGLLYGDVSQFAMQLISAVTVAVFGFAVAYVGFKISHLITPIRVSQDVELEGLDGPEMGVLGYPDFQLHPASRP